MSDVEQYLSKFSGEKRDRLEMMRTMVASLVPDAEESLSYGLIGYKLDGAPLLYFGAFAYHIGLYATPNGHAAFASEFALYKQGKGSVQFPLSEPLPVALIKNVIEYRRNTVRS